MGLITPRKISFDKTDLKGVGKGPPSGLVPIGDSGLYVTPDTPADPMDCNRSPDSPYCGGNPFSLTPIGFDVEPSIDACGPTLTVTPIAAFVKFPPVSIAHRAEGACRNEYEKPKSARSPSMPPLPDAEYYPAADLELFDIDDNEVVYAFFGETRKSISHPLHICEDGVTFVVIESRKYGEAFQCPGVQITIAGTKDNSEVSCREFDDKKHTGDPGPWNSNKECYDPPKSDAPGMYNNLYDGGYSALNYRDVVEVYIGTDGRIAYTYTRRAGEPMSAVDNTVPKPWTMVEFNDQNTHSYVSIQKGKWGIIKKYHSRTPTRVSPENGLAKCIFYQAKCLHVIKAKDCSSYKPNPFYFFPEPPPPPPPPPKKCCMSCCSPSEQSNKDYTPLLQQILKEIQKTNKSVGTFPTEVSIYDSDITKRGAQGKTEKINDIVGAIKKIAERIEIGLKIAGIEEYPISVPQSMITKDEGWLGNAIPNPNVELNNSIELSEWCIKRVDEIVGELEIGIQIKDADPTKPGEQPIGMKVPNFSEAIAEMIGLLLQIAINTETLTNINTRNLTEAGLTRQQSIVNNTYLQAISKYLGFKYKEVSKKVPLTFKPGEESFEEMLQETEIDVAGIEHDDKLGLKDSMLDLLQAAAVIRAVYWRKLDPNANMSQQIFESLKKQRDAGNAINNGTDENNKDDFDRYLEDVEIGFTNKPGIADPNNPYGRPYDQRPRVRKLGGENPNPGT